MISDAQIALVQSSFQDVLPIADAAGMLLYERIFTLAPEVRGLFAEDIAPQARRTMGAVKFVVERLGQLDDAAAYLVKLGARHVNYGVEPEHFPVVGAALMWTLEQGLGAAFTADVRDAWAAAWEILAGAMVTGLLEARAQQPAAV
jgi:hemoglobin-like flavoprotein